MLTIQKSLIILAASAFAILPSSAFAESKKQQIQRLQEQVAVLDYKMSQLDQKNGYDPVTGEYTQSDAARITNLEQELASLTGRIEEMSYRQQQMAAKIDALSKALEVVSQQATPAYSNDPYVQNQNGAQPYGQTGNVPQGDYQQAPLQDVTQGPAISSAPISDDPAVAFDDAFNALLNGEYASAESGFETFLVKFPSDYRAPDAQFRLGEIFLATNENDRAAKAFLNHIKTWPQDARAKESYLKLGTAFQRLGKNQQACQIYGAMQNKYGALPSDVSSRLSVERQKAGCQ